MGMPRLLAAAVVALAALPAGATVLYKSVGPNGSVMFSDLPPGGDAKIIEQRVLNDNGTPGLPSSSGLPRSADLGIALDADEAVARANEKVDLAEHALALARRGIWSPVEGVKLNLIRRTPSDDDRVEFYKKSVKAARQELLDLLRERRVALATR